MKIAEHCQPNHEDNKSFIPHCVWGEDVEIQWGEHGITIDRKNKEIHPVIAFFEAFPKEPSTFLRGEGATIAEAEQNCFIWYTKMINCGTHDWDRRDRTDGYAYCRKCKIGSDILDPLTMCSKCGIPTSWSSRKIEGKELYVCRLHDDHFRDLSQEEAKDIKIMIFSGKAKKVNIDEYKGYQKNPDFQIHQFMIDRPIQNPDPRWLIKTTTEFVEFWMDCNNSNHFFRTRTKEALELDQKRTFSDIIFGPNEE